MRAPIRHVANDGTITFRVRYKEKVDGKWAEKTTTFRGPEKDAKEAAGKFAGMVSAVGVKEALEWQRRNDDDPDIEQPLSPTMNEWAEDYIGTLTKPSAGTKHGYRLDWKNIFGSQIGDVRVDQADRRTIATAVNRLVESGGRKGTGYSDKTMKNAFNFLTAMLNLAVREGLIRSNPCETIELPERTGHESVEMYLFTHDEYDALIEKVNPHYRPLVECLAGTGIRYGEAEALLVSDVNLETAMLRVTKAAKWNTSKSQREVGPTKTRNGKRTVTLPPETVEALRPIVEGRPRNARLFLAPRGGPLRHKSFWQDAWVPACEKIGLTDPRPRPHDLRHAHASWLLELNVPMAVISKRLGHHSISVTADIYGHLSPDIQRAAAEAASIFFSGRDRVAISRTPVALEESA